MSSADESKGDDDVRKKVLGLLEKCDAALGAPKERKKGEVYVDIFEKEELLWLIAETKMKLLAEPTLLELEAPMFVVGDIHGQYKDLSRAIKKCGEPSADTKYLFLGDYVDRGKFGIECITYVCCQKML